LERDTGDHWRREALVQSGSVRIRAVVRVL
jgi:hypothetical protein